MIQLICPKKMLFFKLFQIHKNYHFTIKIFRLSIIIIIRNFLFGHNLFQKGKKINLEFGLIFSGFYK